jgi:ribosomal RNA-processing protein 12
VSPDEGQVNYQLAAPVLYLLDLVLPLVPPQTLRTYFLRTIPTLVAVLDAANSAHTEGSAAVARSIIGAIETLLLAQDFSAWKSRDEMSVLGVFTGYIMGSGTDSRPKVRKRALDAVKTILDNVPANPTALHPAAEDSAMIAFHIVEGQFGSKKGRAKGGSEKDVKAVHSLHLLKMVASAVSWPKTKIRELIELLLKLSSEVYDDNVRLSALEVFQVIFVQASEGMDASHLKEVLEVFPSSCLV